FAAARGEAGGHQAVEPDFVLEEVPALVFDPEGQSRPVRVELTERPAINPDGQLVLALRLPQDHFDPAEAVEMAIVNLADGQPLAGSQFVPIERESVLIFALPVELREQWQAIETCNPAELPFRFIIRPHAAVLEERGQAAGKSSHTHARPRRNPYARVSPCV